MGYLLTLAGGSRVVFMVLILPVVIRLCRRNPPPSAPAKDGFNEVTEDEGTGIGDENTLAQEIHKSKVLHDSRESHRAAQKDEC